MEAILSLLPDPFYDKVKVIWTHLEKNHGIHGVNIAPFPHFSWQGAMEYEQKGLEFTLKTIANLSKPFRVQTSGIGLFTGQCPVIFIQVIKSPQLMRVHQQIWSAIRPLGKNFNPHYQQEVWQPHITLAMGDVVNDKIGQIVQSLADYDFNWEFLVDHIAHFVIAEPAGIIKQKYNFIR
jgi:2'-5' RNA ligase